MIVFTGSLARLRNFETQKKVLKTLEFFPACNTINNFDYYSNFSLNRSYTNQKYLNAEETRNWLGKLGCNVSHQMMYDSFLKTNADWCLVTEDDCVIKNYCENKINQVLEICKQNNSNFVQLYTNPGFRKLQEKEKKVGNGIYNMIPQWHTIAYMISRKGIEILKKNYPMDENIDKFLSSQIKNLNSLCWINNMFLNGGEVPDVKPTYINGQEVWLRSNEGGDLSSLIWHDQ